MTDIQRPVGTTTVKRSIDTTTAKRPLVQVGDLASDGGVVISGDPAAYDKRGVFARLGDTVQSPTNGVGTIQSGTHLDKKTGQQYATVGDQVVYPNGQRATLVTGSPFMNSPVRKP